jgi:ribosomal silencing factor RsfS
MASLELMEARFQVRGLTQVLSIRAELVEHLRAQMAAVLDVKKELSPMDCEVLLILLDTARKENALVEKSSAELEKALKKLKEVVEVAQCHESFKAP